MLNIRLRPQLLTIAAYRRQRAKEGQLSLDKQLMTTVKIRADSGDIRRIQLDEVSFDALWAAYAGTGTAEQPAGTGKTLSYIDDEGDTCALRNDLELQEAYRVSARAGKVLSVFNVPEQGGPPGQDSLPALPAFVGSDIVQFTLNGKSVSVSQPDPRMSLLDYLRNVAGHTGTKSSCRQGGCGACTVVMQQPNSDPNGPASRALAINACLRPLCACDGKIITTTEGIGNARDGYHTVQDKLASGNGSQCGFCSPGMVMSMYSLLSSTPHPTNAQIEENFDGNICRCTGYRPILESFKTAFGPGPHDKVGGALAQAQVAPCCGKSTGHVAPTTFPKQFGTEGSDAIRWVEPTTVHDLCSTLWGAAAASSKCRIVAGNTGHGVYDDSDVVLMVSVAKLPDFQAFGANTAGPGIFFGAAVPIATMIHLFEQQQEHEEAPGYWTALANHMRKIANLQVRNVGSWAGNLALCHRHPIFQSDMATILTAAGATLTMADGNGALRNLDVATYLAIQDVSASALTKLVIPGPGQGRFFRSYKCMKRHQNAHALANAGIQMTINKTIVNGRVALMVSGQPTIVFGGVKPLPQRSTRLEQYLTSKNLADPGVVHSGESAAAPQPSFTFASADLMLCLFARCSAMGILAQDLVPAAEGYATSVKFRTNLMTGFLYKYYVDACVTFGASVAATAQSAAPSWYPRPVSSGVQTFDQDSATGAAVPKLTSHRQAAGEAVYADDNPCAINGLYGAYVLSTKNHGTATVTSYDAAKSMPGFVDFISAADLEAHVSGANICSAHVGIDGQIHTPQVFASPSAHVEGGIDVTYWGQPLGLVLADSRQHAERAARTVLVSYTGVTTPCVTIEQAIAQGKTLAGR